MNNEPVISNTFYCLAHVPDLLPYGSKPRREIAQSPERQVEIRAASRSYSEAVCYPPNQTFIGNISPDELAQIPRPWFEQRCDSTSADQQRQGRFGEIIDQATFYGLLSRADILNPPLLTLEADLKQNLPPPPHFPDPPDTKNH